MVAEVEKLKGLATNMALMSSGRHRAIEALGDIATKEAALASLDVAGDTRLLLSERGKALAQARKILRSL
jgi:hypothetical protein